MTVCERPVYLDPARGRRLADWVHKKGSERVLIIEDKDPGFRVMISETELLVQWVKSVELAATRIWINKWERMLPAIIASHHLSGPSLQQVVLKFKFARIGPEVCDASSFFNKLLKFLMNDSACSSVFVYCLLALTESLPCADMASIGLGPEAGFGEPQ